VRELAHFAERVALGLETQEGASDAVREALGLSDKVAQFEASLLRDALRRHKGEAQPALEELKLPRKTFYDKLQRHGLVPRDFR
jgi:two-component system, NtrC family, C4-dicarboxylate transport response regulator DctD